MYDNRPNGFTEQARRNREVLERRDARNRRFSRIIMTAFWLLVAGASAAVAFHVGVFVGHFVLNF